MKWIGITGGIATGKSTVSKMIQDLGGVVVDADILAREVVEPGSFGLDSIMTYFGPEVLNPSGQLDRKKLGEIVFKDESKRLLLENILHPLIQWRSLQEKEILDERGLDKAFYDATLIYEKGLQSKFDSIIVVYANEEVQKKRLMQRNKIAAEEADKRIAAQMPLAQKLGQANHVIDNSGNKPETKEQLVKILREL